MKKKKLSKAETLGWSLQQADPSTTEQIVEEMVDSRRLKICEEKCVSNRVVCVLRPMCPKRRFLDVMIVAGISLTTKPSLPVFCYKQRLKEFQQDYLDHKSFLPDARIFHEGIMEITGKKKKKKGKNLSLQILESLGGDISSYMEIQPGFYTTILGKNLVLLNEETHISVLNPENRKISPQLFQGLVDLFKKHYDLSVKVSEEGESFYILEFASKKELDPALLQLNLKNLRTDYITGYDEHSIICELDLSSETTGSFFEGLDERITVKDLQGLFEDIEELISTSKKGKD
ncbi:MAG: hypothetical protein ACXAEU_07835 [Candidatus Hodarchaeales archaeon]